MVCLVVLGACSRDTSTGPDVAAGAGISGRASVVLITLDTTRADHLEPYGAEDAETPALAGLAERGVVFDNAFAVTPVTAPSHASLLTGLYPPRHGVRDNLTHPLPGGIPTLAGWLSEAGYRTAAFVSAIVLKRASGLDRGFDVFDDDLGSAAVSRETRMMTERPAAATADRAIEWLRTLGTDKPFFLWVHFYDPHTPYAPPSPWAERFSGQPYDGEIAYMDDQVGRLLQHPLVAADDVIVVAVGDHGEGLGDHGESGHGTLVYNSTLHVPWIMRLPGGPSGVRVATPVSQVDLVPTIAEVLDLALQTGSRELEGRSLVPLLAGEIPVPDRLLFGESKVPFFAYGWASLRTVRQGAIKYIDAPVGELYDLDSDPVEGRNLAGDRAADGRRLAAEIEVWAANDRGSSVTATVDTETEEALRALGYVAGDSGRPKGEGHGNPMELIAVHEELQVAGHLMDSGRPGDAVRRILEVLGRDPDNIAALRDLSRGLASTGRLDEAAAAAEKARTVAPWNSRVFYYGADVEFRRGNHDGALALIDQALALDEGFLEARLERGRYLAELGRFDEANEELGPLLEEHADNPWVALRYAEIIELPAGDHRSAEQRLRTVLSNNPYLADAWLVLGEVLEREDRTADAEAVYREAMALELSSTDLAARLALLLAASGDTAADAALREAIGSSPAARADLHVALGTRLAAAGRNAEARRQFELAAAAPAFSVDARNTRAMTLLQLGRTAEAETVWRSLIRDHPEYGDPWLNLSSLSIQRGEWEEVERLARAVIEREPESPFAWNNLGISLEEQGRTSEAKAAYRRAIEIAPEEWRATFNLGLLEEKGARYKEAAGLFERVLQHAPNHVGSHFHLGTLYASPLGNPARARRHLETAIRLEPGSPRARQADELLRRLR